jgi:HAD superfamily hydrolase (TIGR01509 family)
MKGVKNIIFDLGGVLLNIDYQRVIKAFEALGFEHFDQWYSQKEQTTLFDLLETGEIGAQSFRDNLKKKLNKPVADEALDAAWNSILLDLPAERIALLQKVKQHYRCFLLSNTNEIHIAAFSEQFKKEFGAGTFEELFEKVYYSSVMGMRKPHVTTFLKVIEENGLVPSETLFIDDSYQHIEGAMKAGLQTFFLKKGSTIHELFDAENHLIS